jgi:hypothetical protein
MIRDAALATLRVQQIALQFGMILKDATGANIQFAGGKPVLIDTLARELRIPPPLAQVVGAGLRAAPFGLANP